MPQVITHETNIVLITKHGSVRRENPLSDEHSIDTELAVQRFSKRI